MIKRDTYQEITSGSGSGATQTEIFEIFEGTNTQGLAKSLFENLSGSNTSLANLLIETNTGTFINVANLLQICSSFLGTIKTNVSSSANQLTANSYLNTIDTSTQTTGTNTTSIATYLSTIRTPEIISATGSGTIGVQTHSISFANVGSAVGTITVNGTTVNLPVGATVSYDAGGNNNRFAINKFSYNGTGTTLLIQYVQ